MIHNIKFRAFVYEDEDIDEISEAILNILPEAEIEAEEAEGLLEDNIIILSVVVSKKRFTKTFFNTLLNIRILHVTVTVFRDKTLSFRQIIAKQDFKHPKRFLGFGRRYRDQSAAFGLHRCF